MLIDDYLARVGLTERPEANLAGLTLLHRAHLFSVPYENLDVQLGRKLTTSPAAAVEKIVRQKRGGWCYEMNGTLGWALEQLGFDVTRATGAVMRVALGEPAVANHLVLRVDLPEGSYLADAGFGDGPLAPFPIRPAMHDANGFSFRIENLEDGWWRMHNHENSNAPSFDFHPDRGDEAKFSARCEMLQSDAQSRFVQNLICFRHREAAVDALLGRTLREVTPHGVTSRVIDSPGELLEVLGDVFSLHVPEVAALWPKICARHEEILKQPPPG